MANTLPDSIYVSRKLLAHPAWRNLSGTAKTVLMDFYCRRQMRKTGKDQYVIENNGDIRYPYREAEASGISRTSFARAIDQLIAHGFLRIDHSGSGLRNDPSRYRLMEEWQTWKRGHDKTEQNGRPRRAQTGGFLRVPANTGMVDYSIDCHQKRTSN